MDIITDIDIWIWIAGVLNIFFLLPQARVILKNKSSENISLLTYILALFIQIVGALAGWIYHIPGQMWTLIGASGMSIFIIMLILYYKIKK